MAKEQTTQKKIKVIGTQEYINAQTGEIEVMDVTTYEERDFNFTKVWMRSFLSTLDLIGSRKSSVAFWVVEHVTKENLLPYTYRQISEATKASLDTVTKTMTVLIDSGFLRRLNQGCYIINPDIMFKGSRSGRLNMLTKFQDAAKPVPQEVPLEEQLQTILASIKVLTDKANEISARIEQRQQEEEQAS